MDWSFLNIFKRADFNTLMFSLGVMGWIMNYLYPDIIYFIMIAIMCSVYCIARFVVHLYNAYQVSQTNKANAKYDQEQKDKMAHDRELQAQFVYDRLSCDDQKLLQDVVSKGEKSSYSDVYIIKGRCSNSFMISQISMMLLHDNMIGSWITINESQDTCSIYIKNPLNIIIERKINKKI